MLHPKSRSEFSSRPIGRILRLIYEALSLKLTQVVAIAEAMAPASKYYLNLFLGGVFAVDFIEHSGHAFAFRCRAIVASLFQPYSHFIKLPAQEISSNACLAGFNYHNRQFAFDSTAARYFLIAAQDTAVASASDIVSK